MSIDLSEYEYGKAFDGDYAVELVLLRHRLEHLQALHHAHGCRTLIVIEGWDGAGKGAVIQSLGQSLDPRHSAVHSFAAASVEGSERHFLWRFWQELPRKGRIALFERSYYRRVLDDRVEGNCSETLWQRGFDEINEFEAQQRDSGTQIIKLFLHITADRQRAVLTERLHDPALRWTVTAEQLHRLSVRDGYSEALNTMFEQTDTRWAPWRVIDANEADSAHLSVLRHICDAMASYVPAAFPDIDPETAALAELILSADK